MEQYLSPFSLIQDVSPGEIDKKALLLAKKKLLAEFELEGGNAVVINGRELTKNDIINFFDGLNEAGSLAYHTIVANDIILLRFLEYNLLENGDRFNKTEQYNDAKFIEWLSPYFFTSFSTLAAMCIYNYDEHGWQTLFGNPLLMNGYYMEETWKVVEIAIEKDLQKLRAFAANKGARESYAIDLLVDFSYVSMLRELPEGRFTSLMDEYAHYIMQCSVYVFNKTDQKRAIQMVKNALSLAVSDEIRQAIAGKQAEMESIRRQKTKRSWGRGLGGWGWRGAFFLIYFIIKVIATNSNSGSNYNVNDIPVYYTTPSDSLKFPQLDSLRDRLNQLKIPDSAAPGQAFPPPLKPTSKLDSILKKLKIKDSTALSP